MKFRLFTLAGLAGWVLLLAACGNDATEAPAPAAEAADEIVALPVLPNTLPDTLPALEWVTSTAADQPWGDPRAIRGGTVNVWMDAFPLTLRRVGPDSNGGFAGYLRPGFLGMVQLHPNTLNYIPDLATHWAFAEDGRTVYYRINPRARWSDGEPVKVTDFTFTIEFMRSRDIISPWYNDYYTNRVIAVKTYGDDVVAVQLAAPRPRDELLAESGISPTPEHFHTLNADWVRDYNWKIEPNTGPYQIEEIRKGKWIEFKRKPDWWGDAEPFNAHRFNVDTIRITVIRSIDIAWKHFLNGELDSFGVTLPDYWHDKATGEPFDKGYIDKIWYYSERPQPPSGMWLNMDDPILANRDVRVGLAHAMNIQKVIDTVLRGDYDRMRTHYEGWGDYSNPDIQPREFDLDKADAAFNAAGFDTRGADGIRVNTAGQRLSLRVVYGAPHHTPRLVVLQQEARKAGVDLTLQLLDGAAAFKQIQEKKHQIGWMTWAGVGLSPVYWEFYHSVNAHRTQTNNITNFDDPEMDTMIDAYRVAVDRDARVQLARRMEQRVHDSAALIPTFKVPYERAAYWRWMQLPEGYGTRSSGRGNSGGLFDTMVEGLFWIDPAIKAETLDAMKTGKTFPPVAIKDTRWREN